MRRKPMKQSARPISPACQNMSHAASNRISGGFTNSSGRAPSRAKWNPPNSNAPRPISWHVPARERSISARAGRASEATLIKRMEELGIGRPSTYASTLAVLRERDYVCLDKKRLIPEDKGRLVTAFLESFFTRYVGYDFTAALEEKLDLVSNHELDWKQVLRDFWVDFSGALAGIKDLRTTQVLDSLNELLGPHIFPPKEDGSNSRACPSCGTGQLSLKLGKFGAFIGCSNYPAFKFTRTLTNSSADGAANGERAGVEILGQDPATGDEITLRDGRFGAYVQQGEGEKPKRVSLPKNIASGEVTLAQALGLLSLPRE